MFAEKPNLIQGFDIFLPLGYTIECGTGENPITIRITTPVGTMTSQLPTRPLSNPRQVALSAADTTATDDSRAAAFQSLKQETKTREIHTPRSETLGQQLMATSPSERQKKLGI